MQEQFGRAEKFDEHWFTFALEKSDPDTIDDDEVRTYPAYRVDETVWLGHGEENGRWSLFPKRRAD